MPPPRRNYRKIKKGIDGSGGEAAAGKGRGLHAHESGKVNPCTVTEAAHPEQATGGLAGDQSDSLPAILTSTKKGETV